MVVIDAGRQIELNELDSKALSPRVESRESGSNVRVPRPWHLIKHCPEMVLTDEGIQIVSRDKQEAKARTPNTPM
jgi:hypothetical protein